MVAKANLQETIPIPSGLSNAFKAELGRRMLTEVRERTGRGIDKKGKRFKGYSDEYKDSLDFKIAGKSNSVNLRQTGDMLADIEVLIIGSDSITIGYSSGYDDAGKVEGNVIGSFGNPTGDPSKARDFIGLPSSVVSRIVAEIRSEPEFREQRTERDSAIAGILSRFFIEDVE